MLGIPTIRLVGPLLLALFLTISGSFRPLDFSYVIQSLYRLARHSSLHAIPASTPPHVYILFLTPWLSRHHGSHAIPALMPSRLSRYHLCSHAPNRLSRHRPTARTPGQIISSSLVSPPAAGTSAAGTHISILPRLRESSVSDIAHTHSR